MVEIECQHEADDTVSNAGLGTVDHRLYNVDRLLYELCEFHLMENLYFFFAQPLTPKVFSDSQLHNRRMSKDYDPAGQEPKKFQRTSDQGMSRERLDYCCERIEV